MSTLLSTKPGDRFKQGESGGTYEFVCHALLEANCDPVVVYRSVSHGDYWVRPAKEFFDGRFIRVSEDTAP